MIFRRFSLSVLLAASFLYAAPAPAQAYSADKPLGAAVPQTPGYLKNAGIEQRLNSHLPLKDRFIDEAGRDVALGKYFGSKPVVMALVYYHCGLLCPQVLHGMAEALRGTRFKAGDQYNVLVASIDPTDTPAESVDAKNRFLTTLGNAGTADGVHFLTGPQKSITDLAQATGFHYVRVPGPDGKMDQFAHSSVIMIATPDGRMSKYLSGIDYPSRDVRLAVIQASNHKIGSLSDIVLLYCCNYVPSTGRYSVAILRVLSLAAVFSLVTLAALLFLMRRKPKSQAV
ncbi:MAG: SCO family protein [Acidobacteriaceae bacterium]